jgi:protein TonB
MLMQATSSSGAPIRYYPQRAQRMGVEGKAVIDCEVEASGQLADCKVVSEIPEGYGFGDAALKMSSLFKMKTTTKDGQPASGKRATIPLDFRLPRR